MCLVKIQVLEGISMDLLGLLRLKLKILNENICEWKFCVEEYFAKNTL